MKLKNITISLGVLFTLSYCGDSSNGSKSSWPQIETDEEIVSLNFDTKEPQKEYYGEMPASTDAIWNLSEEVRDMESICAFSDRVFQLDIAAQNVLYSKFFAGSTIEISWNIAEETGSSQSGDLLIIQQIVDVINGCISSHYMDDFGFLGEGNLQEYLTKNRMQVLECDQSFVVLQMTQLNWSIHTINELRNRIRHLLSLKSDRKGFEEYPVLLQGKVLFSSAQFESRFLKVYPNYIAKFGVMSTTCNGKLPFVSFEITALKIRVNGEVYTIEEGVRKIDKEIMKIEESYLFED